MHRQNGVWSQDHLQSGYRGYRVASPHETQRPGVSLQCQLLLHGRRGKGRFRGRAELLGSSAVPRVGPGPGTFPAKAWTSPLRRGLAVRAITITRNYAYYGYVLLARLNA